MVDLFCGPNLPLGKAFLYCGWRCLPVDWALDPSHDLSNPQRQDSIQEQLQDAVFAAAALDCSTKSRAREIPRDLGDGNRCGVTATPRAFQTWELTQEKQMMATGPWQDTVYSACCFMGARCKAQRLRHNIDEIAQWPALHSGWSACVPLQGGGGIHRLAGFWNCSLRFLVGRPHGAGEAPRAPFPLCGNRGQAGTLVAD